jgi:hypothetical protein
MKTVEDYKDDITSEGFAYSDTLLQFCNENTVEDVLRAICQAVELGNTASLQSLAMALGQLINEALDKRAETLADRGNMYARTFADKFDGDLQRLHKLGV